MNRELNDIQIELLNALKWIDGFCRDRGIMYSLHGGTLLGAVREKGFISWDDDADITFTREEYRRFENAIFNTELPDCLIFDSNRRYPKLYFKRPGYPAVWIDVFIYDPISNNKLAQRMKKSLLYFYMILLRDPKTFEVIKKTKKENDLSLFLMKAINYSGQLVPYERKVAGAKKAAQRFGGSGQLIHRANDQKSGINEIQPVYVMSKYTMTEFEDTRLMISVYYDEILTQSYGKDYMTPRKKKNQSTSDAEAVLERRFAEQLFSDRAGEHR